MYTRDFITSFYERHVDMSQSKAQGHELRAPCPCHKDKNPSFSVNLDTGLFKCFSSKCKLFSGGNIHQFKSIVDDISYAEAQRMLDEEFGGEEPKTKAKSNRGRTVKDFPFKQEFLDSCTEDLINNVEKITWVKENCLWTEETIRKFGIGWNGARYLIPIKEHDKLVNVRMYAPEEASKWISTTGFGGTRLFPIENTEYGDIIIVEGEKDCILANQLGFNAVTVTGGAGAFDSSWKQYFKDKRVVICYDVDDAGQNGAKKVMANLNGITMSLKNVVLPVTEPSNADLTDYFLTGATPQDFQALIDEAPMVEDKTISVINITEQVFSASLSEINEQALFYKRCKTKVRTVGKDSAPFIVPKSIQVTCNQDNGRGCFSCGVGDNKGECTQTLNETTPHILELIECSASDKKRIVRELFNIPTCRKFMHTEEGHQPVVRVSVIPSLEEMDYEENATFDAKYVEREMYYIGKDLDNNVDYEIEAIAVPSAKDQTLVHLGYKVTHADSSIENFKMTPEVKKRLSIFQCQTSQNKSMQSTLI